MKKIVVVLAILIAVSGCALMTKVCDNRAEAERIRVEAGILLTQTQSGYDTVMRIAGSNSNPTVAIAAAAIDSALRILGEIYYDKICPMVADYNAAKYAANIAAQAKVEIAIKAAKP